MAKLRIVCLYLSFIAIVMGAASCQKDADVKGTELTKLAATADSAATPGLSVTPGNYLAASGTLKITFKDSTYIFDAAQDSIAFVNVHQEDDQRYYGITAINKAHTLSFGISSAGYVSSNSVKPVAGSQLLVMTDIKTPVMQYTLSRFAGQQDFGTISMSQYNQGSVLAKGEFVTFLAKDDKSSTPFTKVEGTFDLRLK